MAQHSTRAHAAWSASASTRNFACPGAMALIEAMGVEDKESEAAAWGTACHQVAERCLRTGDDAAHYLGTTENTKAHSFVFDEEMAECCTQVFLDYVRGRLQQYRDETGRDDAVLLIEQKFDLASIDPPFEAGGTGDAVMLFPAWGLVEVVDLKTGRNYVNASSPQLKTYGLGAVLANPGPFDTVRTTIVQPRVPGIAPVRSVDIDFADLFDWTQDLKAAMAESAAALASYHDNGDATMAETQRLWAGHYLNPGDHCHATYCPAARSCPALEAKALASALTYFTPTDEIAPPPDPKTLPVEKIVGVLDAADMIEAWINSVRAYARELVEAGEKVGDYILVDKQARRKWRTDVDVVGELKRRMHLEEQYVYEEPKLKSPAQIDSLVGKKGAVLVADLWTKESSGTNLVRSDKTTRAPALPPAQKFFQPETE